MIRWVSAGFTVGMAFLACCFFVGQYLSKLENIVNTKEHWRRDPLPPARPRSALLRLRLRLRVVLRDLPAHVVHVERAHLRDQLLERGARQRARLREQQD